MKHKKLFLFELNEFNLEFLKKYSKLYNLKYIKKLLKLKYQKTACDSLREMQGLDPWTQWVNVHTGQTSKKHNLLQIGESQNLKHPQIWDYLSKKKISSGVWGGMNTKNNDNIYNNVFFPDPWNFSQAIKPNYLQSFFLLPSYLLKNYVKPSKIKIALYSLKFLIFFLKSGFFYSITKKSLFIINYFIKNRINKYYFYSVFDWINLLIFLNLKKKFNFDFSLFFANFLASTQHRIWEDKNRHNENRFTFMILDNMIKEIFLSLKKDEKVIIASGLSQKKLPFKQPYYRQLDQYSFFKKIGLKNFYLQQNMTNDSMIFFHNKSDFKSGFHIIQNLKIDSYKMFHCQKKKISKKQYIFCRIIYNKEANKKTLIKYNNKEFNFFDLCVLDAIRTGEHIPVCHLFSDFKIKKIKMNFEIFNEIMFFFGKTVGKK